MKIRKRTLPADFGAAADERLIDAGPDRELESTSEEAEDYADPTPATPLEPPPLNSAVATASARTPVRRTEADAEYAAPAQDPFRPPPAWPIYLVALAVAVLWALAPIAFAIGYRGGVAPLTNDRFAL